jgi:hypothetical protein
MKIKPEQTQQNKTSKFAPYVAGRTAHIEKIIAQTLRVVDATKYSNVTDYCKALAVVVSEIRAAKANDPSSPYFNKKVLSFSYVTLLRNDGYRRLVDTMFEHSRGTLEQPEIISEEALLKIASLQAQVNLLKDRLSGITTESGSNALIDAQAKDNVAKLKDYLTITLEVYTIMREKLSDALRIVETPTERHKLPGLYNIRGLIADIEALQKIEEGRKFISKL